VTRIEIALYSMPGSRGCVSNVSPLLACPPQFVATPQQSWQCSPRSARLLIFPPMIDYSRNGRQRPVSSSNKMIFSTFSDSRSCLVTRILRFFLQRSLPPTSSTNFYIVMSASVSPSVTSLLAICLHATLGLRAFKKPQRITRVGVCPISQRS
jgi:hypothetical protein